MNDVVDVDQILVTLFNLAEASAASDVQVVEGWDFVEQLGFNVLSIGQAARPNTPAVHVNPRPADGGLCADEYEVIVRCTAVSWDGQMEYRDKRGRVRDMLRDLHAAVDADPTLGGVVQDARVGSQQWTQAADEKGATVQCDFAVAARVAA